MEVTTWFEALRVEGPPLGGSATMQGPEREVNAEQASKTAMRVATLLMLGEAWHRSGSERRTHRPDPPG